MSNETFNEKLTVEVLARFTGSSRGTPIARASFIDGAVWSAQNSNADLLKENQKLTVEWKQLTDRVTVLGADKFLLEKENQELKARIEELENEIKVLQQFDER